MGARNKAELQEIAKFIERFAVLTVDQSITDEAVQLLTAYRLGFGLAIADALIAATAKTMGYSLATKNHKDFHFISGLQLTDYP